MKILPLSLVALIFAGNIFSKVFADEPDATEPQISLELLEFLGDFSTSDGKWIDPMEVTTMLDETPASTEKPTEKSE